MSKKLKNVDISTQSNNEFDEYVKLFRDGKAIVPMKKFTSIFDKFRNNNKGEPKSVSYDELYRYYLADGAIKQSFQSVADMVIAYGSDFDLPLPLSKSLSQEQKDFLHLMDLWASYVKLDTIKKMAIISGLIFGDFFAEKVYDERNGGRLSNNSWGIKRIKVIDPRTIYIDRAPDGTVRNYYQHPRADQIQPRSIMRSKKSIRIPPAQMIHIKFGDVINETYGKSKLFSLLDTIDMKIGLMSDAVSIAQKRASPFLVWSLGTEDKVFPAPLLEEIRADLENQMLDVTENDVFVPGFIKVEVVGGDNNAGVDLIPLIEHMNKEIAIAAGVPDIMFAGSVASGESAKAKEELWMRQTKSLQTFLGEQFRNQIYLDLVYPPVKRMSGNNAIWVSRINELTPSDYEKVPYDKWHIIESVADQRLRLKEMSAAGLIAKDEGRLQMKLRGELKDDDLPLPVRAKNEPKTDISKSDTSLRPPSAGNPSKTPSKRKMV